MSEVSPEVQQMINLIHSESLPLKREVQTLKQEVENLKSEIKRIEMNVNHNHFKL